MTQTSSNEVLASAREVPGMVAFFALVGEAISHGRSKVALRMLCAVGLSRQRGWSLIGSWERMIELETRTGWTPEVTAMGFAMSDLSGWREVRWQEVAGQFALAADPDGAGA